MLLNLSVKKAFVCLAIISIAIFGCQKTTLNTEETSVSEQASKGLNTTATLGSCEVLNITVAQSYNAVSNQTTFTWTLVNTNPGNGSNGTYKNLSHWTMILCERAAANLVSQSNSLGVQVAPTYMVDPAMTCNADSVLKFNYGTSASIPSVYSLVLNGKFSVDTAAKGFFKAGIGCCSRTFPGISCVVEVPVCSLSQGYWFANAAHSWNNLTVTIGGNTYTQAEGQVLWSSHPGGQGGNATRSFYQAAAIMLSIPVAANRPTSVAADIALIDAYLTGLGKLSSSNHPNLHTLAATSASDAAGRISNWICANHCGTTEEDPTSCQ